MKREIGVHRQTIVNKEQVEFELQTKPFLEQQRYLDCLKGPVAPTEAERLAMLNSKVYYVPSRNDYVDIVKEQLLAARRQVETQNQVSRVIDLKKEIQKNTPIIQKALNHKEEIQFLNLPQDPINPIIIEDNANRNVVYNPLRNPLPFKSNNEFRK
jgi:hypothetical protein